MNYSVNSGPSPSGGIAWTQRGPRRSLGIGLGSHYRSTVTSGFTPPAIFVDAEFYFDGRAYSGAGDWLDQSGHGYHAVPGAGTNAPTFVPDPTHPGFLYSIDDYHTIGAPTDVGLMFNTGESFTIAVAVQHTVDGSVNRAMIGKKFQGLSRGYRSSKLTTVQNTFIVGGTGGFPAAATAPGAEGVRACVTGLRDAGVTFTCYTDGLTTLSTADTSLDTRDVTANARIGASANPGLFYNGLVFGAALWRKQLTLAEIAGLNGANGFAL